MPGLARRLPAHRPARLLLVLRGLHPHHRLHVQPARQVAEGVQRHRVAQARSPRSTICCRASSGGRTTTASPIRTRASSTTSSTRRPRSCASICPRTPTRLLSVTDHCLRSRNYVNVVVAGKQPAPQWLTMDQAIKHCSSGLGIWEWASNDRGGEPDVVMACCGDVPTLETLAAVDLLRDHAPDLKVRVINVVDLMRLQPPSEHPHGDQRSRLRRPLHRRQADHLRLPRLSLAHPPPDLPPPRPRQHPRARLQGGGDDDHAVRHVRAQRHRPVPSRQRRDRPRPRPRLARRLRQAGDPRQADRAPASTSSVTATTCPRSRTGSGAAARVETARGAAATGGDNV